MKNDPENAYNWDFLTDAYMSSGDLEQGEKCDNKALAIDPESVYFKRTKEKINKLKKQ